VEANRTVHFVGWQTDNILHSHGNLALTLLLEDLSNESLSCQTILKPPITNQSIREVGNSPKASPMALWTLNVLILGGSSEAFCESMELLRKESEVMF
jgi:hypothetical protein